MKFWKIEGFFIKKNKNWGARCKIYKKYENFKGFFKILTPPTQLSLVVPRSTPRFDDDDDSIPNVSRMDKHPLSLFEPSQKFEWGHDFWFVVAIPIARAASCQISVPFQNARTDSCHSADISNPIVTWVHATSLFSIYVVILVMLVQGIILS